MFSIIRAAVHGPRLRAAFRASASAALVSLAACGDSSAPGNAVGLGGSVTGGSGGGVVTPGDLVMKVETSLPPGQSGFFSAAGQAQGSASGNPGDYGAHVDDQRLLYWGFDAKPGALNTKPGSPSSPLSGVQVYRDAYGVPIVYASNVHDLWYGVGYAIAQDRLFLMDAVRRMGQGRMGELTGCGAVPGDIQERTLTYTAAEYQAFYDRLTQDAKDAVQGYVDGANAWVATLVTNPDDLPAEYGLLTTTPANFTVQDVLASGVFITRFVAAEGGNEFQNIRLLKLLAQQYGSMDEGVKAFQDFDWLEDPQAVVTVPRSDGTFSNQPQPAQGRDAVLASMATWATGLPETLWKGAGTGNAAAPQPCGLQSMLPLSTLGGGRSAAAHEVVSPRASGASVVSKTLVSATSRKRDAARSAIREVALALANLRTQLHGGSHAYALGPTRTRDHGTMLLSGPQLGYTYPTLLVEYEIEGAGYSARGTSVPILPVVGIGYSSDLAWGLTTGYSKTIDSFIETICSTAQIAAGTCKADQYFHQSQWKDMSCRDETFSYRASAQGVPAGPASLTTTAHVCRTVHGPIVARDDVAGLARSVQYAMFGHEIDTIEGIRQWNKAHTLQDFVAGVKQVTWNENVTVATRDGHIAYFHPGLFPARSADTDMRLPIPGSGAYDFGANLAFEQLPHDIDPPQGYLGNWNTKPAYGWLDGEGLVYSSRPGGPGQRVTSILDELPTRSDWSFADFKALDTHVGTTDHRARNYLPVLQAFRTSADAQLTDVQKAALDLMLGWDRSHFGPGIDLSDTSAKDGPAATVFGEMVDAVRNELFGSLKTLVIDDMGTADTSDDFTVYDRLTDVGSHVFDMAAAADNVALRILAPASSGLAIRRDYTGGRDRNAVLLAALNAALANMATEYNGGATLTAADLPKCQRVHPRSTLCSLTGVIGPGSVPGTSCVTMPYEDRGSWVHRVAYEHP